MNKSDQQIMPFIFSVRMLNSSSQVKAGCCPLVEAAAESSAQKSRQDWRPALCLLVLHCPLLCLPSVSSLRQLNDQTEQSKQPLGLGRSLPFIPSRKQDQELRGAAMP